MVMHPAFAERRLAHQLGAESCRPYSLKNHPDLNFKMLHILIDWLTAVQVKLKLLDETLFLTADMIVRYLVATPSAIPIQQLQLVGAASMYLAASLVELHPLEPDGMRGMCGDGTYSEGQFSQMVTSLINALDGMLIRPNTFTFLRHEEEPCKETWLTRYIAEATLLHPEVLKYKASEVAAACRAIAAHTCNPFKPVPDAVTRAVTRAVYAALTERKQNWSKRATRDKYQAHQRFGVSDEPIRKARWL